MSFDLREFRGNMNKYGLARDNLFIVNITPPRAGIDVDMPHKDLQFFCKSVQLPSMNINTTPVMNRGFGSNERRPTGMEYDNLNTIFLIDSEYKVKSFFHAWMQRVINFNSVDGYDRVLEGTRMLPFEMGYLDDFKGKVTVYVYSYGDRSFTFKYEFEHVYPVSMGSVDLAWENNGQVLSAPVSFVYEKFKMDSFGRSIRANSRYQARGNEFIFALGNFGQALDSFGVDNNIQQVVNDFTSISSGISSFGNKINALLNNTFY